MFTNAIVGEPGVGGILLVGRTIAIPAMTVPASMGLWLIVWATYQAQHARYARDEDQ